MVTGKSNKKIGMRNDLFSQLQHLLGKAVILMAALGLYMGAYRGMAEETPLSEYQVKALFLFNFAKYVDWPANTFAAANTPIVIGVLGENKIENSLKESV